MQVCLLRVNLAQDAYQPVEEVALAPLWPTWNVDKRSKIGVAHRGTALQPFFNGLLRFDFPLHSDEVTKIDRAVAVEVRSVEVRLVASLRGFDLVRPAEACSEYVVIQ